MSDLFISYSRRDIAFARLLHDALVQNGLKPWIDWEDIPPSVDWLKEIYAAIEEADVFLFIISQASVASEMCGLEVAHAAENNKRLIPVVIGDVDPRSVPPYLAALQWITYGPEGEFEPVAAALLKAIRTDQAWVKEHTRLQNRALEWERSGRKPSSLLRGDELAGAERWLSGGAGKAPPPTALHAQYVLAGRQEAMREEQEKNRLQRQTNRRLRAVVIAVAAGLVAASVLGTTAYRAGQQYLAESHVRATAEANAVSESLTRATAEARAVSEARSRATAQVQAEAAITRAVAERNEAERQARLALSGQLAAQSRVYLGSSPDLSPLFAAESLSTYDTFQARSSLLSALLQSPRLDRILRTAENATAVAFSPDGTTLAAAACTARNAAQACTESGLQFWDLASGMLRGEPVPALAGFARSLAYAPDGKSLFIGGGGGVIRQWSVAGQRFTAEYSLRQYGVIALAVDPGARYLAAGGCSMLSLTDGRCDRGALALWDLSASGSVSMTLDGLAPGSRGIAFGPDGRWLAAADCARLEKDTLGVERCVQGEVRRWSPPDATLERHPVTASLSAIVSVAFTPDGKILFAGESKGPVHRLDSATLLPAGSPIAAQGTLSNLLVSPQLGGLLISSSFSHPAQLWRLDGWRTPAGDLAARQGNVFYHSLALSPDGRTLAATTCPGGAGLSYPCPAGAEIQLWDVALWHPAEQYLPLGAGERVEAALGAGDAGVYLAHSEGMLRRLDPAVRELADEVLYQGDRELLQVRLSADGRRAATVDCARRSAAAKVAVCEESEIRFWDVAHWQPLGEPARVEAWVLHPTFSPDGTKLVVDGPDGVAIILDSATGAQLEAIDAGISPGFVEFGFTPDSKKLLVAGCVPDKGLLCQYHDAVMVFDAASGIQVGSTIGPFDESISALAVQPSGRGNVIAISLSSFSKHEWSLWDWESGTQVGRPVQGGAGALAFSPDGRSIAAGGCLTTPEGGCGQTAITLWDVEQQQALGAPLIGDGGEWRALAFSPDGLRLASSTARGLSVWSLDPADWRQRACRTANRNLSEAEWAAFLPGTPYHAVCAGLP